VIVYCCANETEKGSEMSYLFKPETTQQHIARAFAYPNYAVCQ